MQQTYRRWCRSAWWNQIQFSLRLFSFGESLYHFRWGSFLSWLNAVSFPRSPTLWFSLTRSKKCRRRFQDHKKNGHWWIGTESSLFKQICVMWENQFSDLSFSVSEVYSSDVRISPWVRLPSYLSALLTEHWLTRVLFFVWTAPPVPQNFSTSNRTTTSLTLTWASTPSATSYNIKYNNNGSVQINTTQTAIALTGLVPGSLYEFMLTATGAGGQSTNAYITSSTGISEFCVGGVSQTRSYVA